MLALFLAALFLLVLGILLLWQGRRAQRNSGLPSGRVIYADPKVLGAPEKPLFDGDHHLTGKPDYLVQEGEAVIPVEVKSRWAPPQPHPGHIYQLLAYCLLVEKSTGKRPPYGIIRYRNRSFAIDYTREAERDLLLLLEEIQEAGVRREQDRSHEEPARCAHCGYRSMCDQKL